MADEFNIVPYVVRSAGTDVPPEEVQAGINSLALQTTLALNSLAGGGGTIPAGNVTFTQSGAGATTRTIQIKEQESVSIADFAGFDPTGTALSTTALVNAMASLGAAGGTVIIPHGVIVRLGNVTVPHNVHIIGPYYFVGTPGNNGSAPYGSLGALTLDTGTTITLGSGSSVSGCLVYPTGMTFPQANSSAWTGTAFTAGGDDAGLHNSMVLGFNRAFFSNSFQRPRVSYLYGDNNTGVEITACADVPILDRCHMWPFATIASGGGAAANQRTGDAYYLHDTVDGPVMLGLFAYGYQNGFRFSNVSTINATNCMADNTGSFANSAGWRFEGNINGFTGCGNSTWSQTNGVVVNMNAGQTVDLSKMLFNTNTTHIAVTGGNAKAHQSEFFTATTWLTVNNATSIIELDGNTLASVSNMVTASVGTSNVYVGTNNVNLTSANGTSLTTTNVASRTLASADPLALPPYGSVFIVSGTTGFGNLSGGWANRSVTLIFQGSLTVFHGTANQNSMALQGGNNFTANANSTLTLKHNGTQWYQDGGAGVTAGSFTTLTASGGLNSTAVGNTTPSTGAFTTLAASGAVTGTGFVNRFASPGPIGNTAASTGAFTTLSSTGTYTPDQLNGIVGTTTNNNANAGSVGEFISSTGTAVSLTTGTPANITSISLTAGDWEVSGSVVFNPAGGAVPSAVTAGASTTTATLPAQPFFFISQSTTFPANGLQGEPIPPNRFSLAGTTTVFLVAQANFTPGTCTGTGIIRARRVR